MWEIFRHISNYKISPDSCLFLFSIEKNIQSAYIDSSKCIKELIDAELVYYKAENKHKEFIITEKGKKIISELNGYFEKAKQKTNKQLMGKDFANLVSKYRELFPKGKLPSGKPARNNVKALYESFRWFFQTYDYTWDEVLKATKRYVNEYKEDNYLYMMTSQYFISKQDKHKVKKSELADYCDMIRDGVEEENKNYFKDKVV